MVELVLAECHVKVGYVDGLDMGKETHLQAGFDAGFRDGSLESFHAAFDRGVIGYVFAACTSTSSSGCRG